MKLVIDAHTLSLMLTLNASAVDPAGKILNLLLSYSNCCLEKSYCILNVKGAEIQISETVKLANI